MSFDFADLSTVEKANSGVAMTVRHPTTGLPLTGSDGKPVTLTLAGVDSDVFRNAKRRTADHFATVVRSGGDPDVERQRTETVADCTLGWSANFSLNGKSLKHSAESARDLYEALPWLREQADAFIADRGNYFLVQSKEGSPG